MRCHAMQGRRFILHNNPHSIPDSEYCICTAVVNNIPVAADKARRIGMEQSSAPAHVRYCNLATRSRICKTERSLVYPYSVLTEMRFLETL